MQLKRKRSIGESLATATCSLLGALPAALHEQLGQALVAPVLLPVRVQTQSVAARFREITAHACVLSVVRDLALHFALRPLAGGLGHHVATPAIAEQDLGRALDRDLRAVR